MRDLKDINILNESYEYDGCIMPSNKPYICERFVGLYHEELPPTMVAIAVDEAVSSIEYGSDLPFENPFDIERWCLMYHWAWSKGLFDDKLRGLIPNAENCWLSAIHLALEVSPVLNAGDILLGMLDWWNLFYQSSGE